MPTVLTTIRLDQSDRDEAKAILKDVGLNISSATNLFLKAIIRENGLPFELKLKNPKINYVDTYLAPLMSERNRVNKTNISTSRIKKILQFYKKETNIQRKKITL